MDKLKLVLPQGVARWGATIDCSCSMLSAVRVDFLRILSRRQFDDEEGKGEGKGACAHSHMTGLRTAVGGRRTVPRYPGDTNVNQLLQRG